VLNFIASVDMGEKVGVERVLEVWGQMRQSLTCLQLAKRSSAFLYLGVRDIGGL
jgi:hypothetical protein